MKVNSSHVHFQFNTVRNIPCGLSQQNGHTAQGERERGRREERWVGGGGVRREGRGERGSREGKGEGRQ